MTLAEQLTTDLSVFFDTDDFAQPITYNGSDILAIVDYGMDASGENARTARIVVKVADVPSPAYRDPVVIGSDTWRVFRDPGKEVAVKGDGHVWELSLVRDERPLW